MNDKKLKAAARAYCTFPERAERLADRILSPEWIEKENRLINRVLIFLAGVGAGVAWVTWGQGL